MPTVLIVEDERITRETLRDQIPWTRLGIDRVETARDGVDALEKIERRMPDLIVCDIRMPRMSGIDLAQIVRERDPHCRIIFLSGYSEKEYLKAAIRLHAADYLDKPLNLGEVSAAVERNVQAIRERASSSTETEHARKVLSELEPLLRESFVLELVRPVTSLAALRERHERRIVEPFLIGPLRAAIVEVELAVDSESPLELRIKETIRTLNQSSSPPIALAAWQESPDRIGILFVGEEVANAESLEQRLDGLAPLLVRHFGTGVGLWFGVGPAVPSPEGISNSYTGALAALAMRFYSPTRRFLYPPTSAPPSPFQLEEALERELRNALTLRNLERAAASLRTLEAHAQRVSDPETTHVRETYRGVLALFFEAAPGWEPAEIRIELERLQQAVQTQRTLAGLAGLAESTLRRCYAPGSGGEATARRTARIKEYIRAHHSDPDLLVATIAAGVGLSESYLCTVFKQACGITVKDHLTRVRIERAKELLRDTSDKLQAVALRVGFRDANYFSTVFKREVGITPREYRERSL